MQKYQYFELTEFLKSEEALNRKIDNSLTFEIVEHLKELITKILKPISLYLLIIYRFYNSIRMYVNEILD